MTQMFQVGLRFLRHGRVAHVANFHQINQRVELRSDDGEVVVLSADSLRREAVDGDIQMLPGEER